jgi:hypothetical protein
VLVVLGGEDVVAERSFGNLPDVDIVEAGQLTAYDVVKSDWVVFTDETVPGLVSDAPEGAVAFSSARPEALEPAEEEDELEGDDEPSETDLAEADDSESDMDEDEETAAAEASGEEAAGNEAADATDDEQDEEEDK